MLGRGDHPLLHHAHEGARRIGPRQSLAQIAGRRLAGKPHIAGAELASRHGNEMRRKIDLHVRPRRACQLLLDLRHVTMIADTVGRESLACFREEDVLLQRPPRPGHAGLRINDDVLAGDQLVLHERKQSEQHGGGVAAGTGDEPRGADRLAVMLGQAVDGALHELRRAVLAAIPFRVGTKIAQAKVGRHVHDLHARRQLLDLAMGGAVRQAAKGDIDRVPVGLVGGDEVRQAKTAEMREDLRQRLPGMALRHEGNDLDVRMPGGEPDQVGAGIAGGAEHGGPDGVGSHGRDSLESVRKFCGGLTPHIVIPAKAGIQHNDR